MKSLCMFAVAMLATASIASAGEVKTTSDGKPYFESTQLSTKYYTVLSVDTTTRVLQAQSDAGDTVSITVKPEVTTLAKLKKGNRVKVQVTERFTVRVDSAGPAEVTRETMRADARPGDKPSVELMERTSYKAKVTAIDKAKGTVSLSDPEAGSFELTPLDPANLDLVKLGDLVVFTTTVTTAASIEPAPAKGKSAAKPAAAGKK